MTRERALPRFPASGGEYVDSGAKGAVNVLCMAGSENGAYQASSHHSPFEHPQRTRPKHRDLRLTHLGRALVSANGETATPLKDLSGAFATESEHASTPCAAPLHHPKAPDLGPSRVEVPRMSVATLRAPPREHVGVARLGRRQRGGWACAGRRRACIRTAGRQTWTERGTYISVRPSARAPSSLRLRPAMT